MEIQIIGVKEEATRTGKDKWLVATNVGNMSVWDEKLAKELDGFSGQTVNIDIRQPAEGTNYLPTITGMVSADSGKILKEVQNGERSLNGQEDMPVTMAIRENIRKSNLPEPTDRDKSIIAQCLVKAVIANLDTGVSVKTAVLMYKEALELLG